MNDKTLIDLFYKIITLIKNKGLSCDIVNGPYSFYYVYIYRQDSLMEDRLTISKIWIDDYTKKYKIRELIRILKLYDNKNYRGRISYR